MIAIRACCEEDLPQISLLLQQLWPSATIVQDCLRAVFLRGLSSDLQHYFCAEEEGRIVGFCSVVLKNNLWQQGYLAHVDELVVEAQRRGEGIGTRLLQAAMKIAENRGCKRLELDSALHRTDAHRFYEQRGFENRAFLFSAKLAD